MGEDRKNLITVAGTQFFQLLKFERKKGQQGHYLTWNMGAGLFPKPAFVYSLYARGTPALGKAQERSFPMKRRKISSWI